MLLGGGQAVQWCYPVNAINQRWALAVFKGPLRIAYDNLSNKKPQVSSFAINQCIDHLWIQNYPRWRLRNVNPGVQCADGPIRLPGSVMYCYSWAWNNHQGTYGWRRSTIRIYVYIYVCTLGMRSHPSVIRPAPKPPWGNRCCELYNVSMDHWSIDTETRTAKADSAICCLWSAVAAFALACVICQAGLIKLSRVTIRLHHQSNCPKRLLYCTHM